MDETTVFIEDEQAMESFAAQIGSRVQGGECFELKSDLGGGKTTFARGLVSGMGSSDNVASPTFTIGKQYRTSDFTIYHYDFYRLQDPGLVAEELHEVVYDPKSVIIVEWAQTVQEVLPQSRVIVEIELTPDDTNARILQIYYLDTYRYLFKGLT